MTKATQLPTCFWMSVACCSPTGGAINPTGHLAARTFDLNLEEMEDRHHLTFDTYEVGKTHAGGISESDGVLLGERSFTRDQFREFMFSQSRTSS